MGGVLDILGQQQKSRSLFLLWYDETMPPPYPRFGSIIVIEYAEVGQHWHYTRGQSEHHQPALHRDALHLKLLLAHFPHTSFIPKLTANSRFVSFERINRKSFDTICLYTQGVVVFMFIFPTK